MACSEMAKMIQLAKAGADEGRMGQLTVGQPSNFSSSIITISVVYGEYGPNRYIYAHGLE